MERSENMGGVQATFKSAFFTNNVLQKVPVLQTGGGRGDALACHLSVN